MTTVFVLINSAIGAENTVLTALQAIEAVVEPYIVYGVYDIIAKVQEASMDDIKTIIHDEIRKITEVRNTLTMVVVEDIS
ncbi:MAG: Lrp/AsnC ligand binding domain-containing protein [Candidatus Hodarchaeales archaeon]|jgi:DNA-binding Lrp family transcriptional regulator